MAHIGFRALSAQLAAKGAHDPDALAAWIGKKKYGRGQFDAMAAAARRRKDGANAASRYGEALRDVPFEIEASTDGRTLAGYAAVFDRATTIRDSLGEFEEIVRRGTFTRSLGERRPVVMFDHGKHPLVGSIPLGVLQRAEEDSRGLYTETRLTDSWLTEPVRAAIRDGAITGMSFRFSVPDGGDSWSTRAGGMQVREIRDADVSELGPVVFPAYRDTEVYIRSALSHLPDLSGASVARSAERGHEDGQADEAAKARAARGRLLQLRGIRS